MPCPTLFTIAVWLGGKTTSQKRTSRRFGPRRILLGENRRHRNLPHLFSDHASQSGTSEPGATRKILPQRVRGAWFHEQKSVTERFCRNGIGFFSMPRRRSCCVKLAVSI